MADPWAQLAPFDREIETGDQVLLIAATGGAKSTLVATLTLDVPSLVALDEKGALSLPNARLVELPPYPKSGDESAVAQWGAYLRRGLAYREQESNRVVIRPHVLDIEHYEAHDAIFHAVYDRRGTILWIDEITGTGSNANRTQPWLRGLSSRGRTRPVGLWTCTQAPYALTPLILRRNATYLVFGPLDPEDAKGINRPGIEIAVGLPRKQGRFIVYTAGEAQPKRLYLPIPNRLKGWRAP